MKWPKVSVRFCIVVAILLVIALVWVISGGGGNYKWRLRWTRTSLIFCRKSIRLFAEQTGRFPKTLSELNEYGRKSPDKISWRGTPREHISARYANSSESNELNGTGGLYYNPNTGVLKVNLTKPLKSYWRFYFGERRDEVPAAW